MTLTRAEWKLIGKVLLATQGPAYAERLRARAIESDDPDERAKLLQWARSVERGAGSAKETVDDIEALYDLIFGKAKRRAAPRSRTSRR
jgi:hypothetical protein